MYNTAIFGGIRNIHMGVDIGGPVGTPCMAFTDGEISHFGYNSEPGDYGHVIITSGRFEHQHRHTNENIPALHPLGQASRYPPSLENHN